MSTERLASKIYEAKIKRKTMKNMEGISRNSGNTEILNGRYLTDSTKKKKKEGKINYTS